MLNIKRSELGDRMDSQNVHLIIGSVEYSENMENMQRIYREYMLNIKRSALADRMDSQNESLIIGSGEYNENIERL